MSENILSLGDILIQSASTAPDRTAVFFEDRRITYRELENLSLKLAGRLQKEGVRAGDRVAILLSNRPEYLECYFAVFLLGATAVPLNQLLSPAEIEDILGDCTPQTIITENIFESLVKNRWPKLIIDQLLAGPETAASLPKVEPESLAVFIYTSGTTGKPKGVMLSHRNLLSNVRSALQACKLTSKDRFLLFLPLFHSFSLTVCFLIPCYLGAKIVLLPSLSREKIRKAIIKRRVTVFVGIPTIFALMSQRKLAWWQRLLNPVKIYLSGGAPLPKEVLIAFEREYRKPLLEGYGLSEASPGVSINRSDGSRPPGSIGLPIPGVTVRIVGENGKELPTGEVGELLVKGENVMVGYYNQPEVTARTIRDGWLYTGDLGYKDENGFLYIADRKKDMLIVHGCNVYPREIEEVLIQHEGVAEAAVIGVPDKSRGEVPRAFVVLNEGAAIDGLELKRFCKGKLAGYKIPGTIEIIRELPKTATGKVVKRELREKNFKNL